MLAGLIVAIYTGAWRWQRGR